MSRTETFLFAITQLLLLRRYISAMVTTQNIADEYQRVRHFHNIFEEIRAA